MYPKELMAGLYWGFYGGKHNSIESFIQAVTDYNQDFDTMWNPNETVLASKTVTIQYSYWNFEKEDEIQEVFDLDADNELGFTASELLFKVHNKVVDKLENEKHRFFEGFLLGQRVYYKNLNKPFYFINQGM